MGKGVHDHQAFYLFQFVLQPLGLYQIILHIGENFRIMLDQEFAGFDSQGVNGPRLSYLSQPVDDDGRGGEIA